MLRIVRVGFPIHVTGATEIPFRSNTVAADADIILFQLQFSTYLSAKLPTGGRSFDGANSTIVIRDLLHWGEELKAAFEAGRTVFVFLKDPGILKINTGGKTSDLNPYSLLPLGLSGLDSRVGELMQAQGRDNPLKAYLDELHSFLRYELIVRGASFRPLLTTRNGEPVGGIIGVARGNLVFVPPFRNLDNLESTAVGGNIVRIITAIHDQLQRMPATVPPEWIKDEAFKSRKDRELAAEFTAIQKAQGELQRRLSLLQEAQAAEDLLRQLAYEQGHRLEEAVRSAVAVLGCELEPNHVGDMSFDLVFTMEGVRFIGEVEGRDNKAINIDKLSQLIRDVQDDFEREEVKVQARGILFGNGYRLVPPSDRGDCFTEKVRLSAERAGICVVQTLDLLRVAQYIRDSNDLSYASVCRKAILEQAGCQVRFPPQPPG